MTTPLGLLPTNVGTTDWSADADKGQQEHKDWHDRLHAMRLFAPALPFANAMLFPWLGLSTASDMAVGNLRATPVTPLRSCTISSASIEVTTAVAGSAMRLGIYAHDTANNKMGPLIQEFGVVTGDTTGIKTLTVTNLTLQEGVTYWTAALNESTGAVMTYRSLINNGVTVPGFPNNTNPSTIYHSALGVTGVTSGALPSTITAGGSGYRWPCLVFLMVGALV